MKSKFILELQNLTLLPLLALLYKPKIIAHLNRYKIRGAVQLGHWVYKESFLYSLVK